MANDNKIDILLSTYNGERYLRALLESVLKQDFKDWRLLIRDDGSSDGTLDIVQEYCQKYADKINLVASHEGNIGPCASYGRLMKFSHAYYVMFCDQDDVWLKEKISLSMAKIGELEKEHGLRVPLLVYTNSFITDENLRQICDATKAYMGNGLVEFTMFRNLILKNVIVGNTVLINKNLVDLSSPIPQGAIMHDWWAVIVASAFGRIGYVSKPTVLYRQHSHNYYGIRKSCLLKKFIYFVPEFRRSMHFQGLVHKQIKAFYERFQNVISKGSIPMSPEVPIASSFANLETLSFWERKFFLLKFYKNCPYSSKFLMDIIFDHKIYQWFL